MVSEPGKIVLTSLFVGAVAIAAYFSQSNKNWLSTDELGLERDSASAHYTRGDMVTGSVKSGPVVARSDSAAAIAGDLQAARNSLQRNDLVAAQAQLDVVRSAHRDDDQILALQKEIAAREEQAQHALAAVRVEKPTQPGAKSARSSSPSSGKTGRSHKIHFATHEHSNRASSYAKTRYVPETVVAVSAAGTTSGRTSSTGAPAVSSSSSPVSTQVRVVTNVASAPVASPPTQATSAPPPDPHAESTAQAAPVQSAAQLAPSTGSTLLKSDGGPKTRAEVRAEIARARADGTLPAFGNPDPAGPGGAPSLTGALRH
ncbi:DUF4148 domain-containing protein [Paraburkholderia sp. 1N]|uniref:DUF4148 domain-containing protein n=1 Tax=Paraburkholderia solitsugae TaxID=2675748 RepID=A0ABX2BNU6_9BURK|nr:DUF4148 domain-containing protein [Paraburkholderia solitsugae]NPT42587.1 DUF4148 domain-containing protein [Paraburkholderia solitsugae]